MTTLGAPANSGAARCPRDPGGTNHFSRAATGPTRGPHPAWAALAGDTRCGACSTRRDTPRTLPQHTHVLSHSQLGEHQALRMDGNLGSDHTGSGPGSRVDTPSAPSPHSPPSLLTLTHPPNTRARVALFLVIPSPIHTPSHARVHTKCPPEPSGQRSQSRVDSRKRDPGIPRFSAPTSTP